MSEKLKSGKTEFEIIRFDRYNQMLREYSKLEPKLHETVLGVMERELSREKLDFVQGTGAGSKSGYRRPREG